MERNVRWMGVAGGIRATGLSLILPYFALYLRNVLGLGFEEIGILSAVVGAVPLAIVPIAGLITDRLGRRRLFVAALFAEGAAVLAAAGAMEYRALIPLVIAVSLSQTVGTIAGPALSAYVADLVAASERTLGFTWLRVGWNVGFTLGVLSGGALVGTLGFVFVGAAAGTVLLVGTTFVALVLEPSPYDRALRERRRATSPTADPRPTASESLRTIGRDRAFLLLCVAGALGMLTVNQWGVTFPVYANSVLGIPYSLIGAGLALNGVLVVAAQGWTTRAVLGRRHTSMMAGGVALYAVAFLAFGGIRVFPVGLLVTFFAVIFVLTMGENVLSIATNTLPSNLAPPTEIGAYNGAFFAALGAGTLLAPTLGGLLIAAVPDPLVLWGLLSIPAVPAIAIVLGGVAPRLPPDANRA